MPKSTFYLIELFSALMLYEIPPDTTGGFYHFTEKRLCANCASVYGSSLTIFSDRFITMTYYLIKRTFIKAVSVIVRKTFG